MSEIRADRIYSEDGSAGPSFPKGIPNVVLSGITTATTLGVTTVTATNLTVNGNAYPTAGSLGNRNKVINGKLNVDQYDVSVTADGFFVDRWKYSADSSGKATVQKDNQSPVGFEKSIFVTSSSAYSVPSGETYKLRHCIEGYNISELEFGTADAKTITLSFYVRSSLTGTFGGALRNSGASRSYPFTYSISSANTWEYKTVTIPGDTSGTWNTGNGIGIEIDFGLAVGSTYSGTAGAWAGANYVSATGATSVLGTNAATFYLTGVQLEVGTVATPFEHRSYGDELARCQRYYYKTFPGVSNANLGAGYVVTTSQANGTIPFPVSMRAAPTSLEQSGTASDYAVANRSTLTACTSVPTIGGSRSINACRVSFTTGATLNLGDGATLNTNSSNGFLAFTAEL